MDASLVRRLSRRRVLGLIAAGAALGAGSIAGTQALAAAKGTAIWVYKDPSCGCCGEWAKILRRAGFAVRVYNETDMDRIKRQAKIPDDLASCHTAFVEGYFVEGHVPVEALRKLLAERPAIAGIAVPGMPEGSPGMPPGDSEPFDVVALGKDGSRSRFMSFR